MMLWVAFIILISLFLALDLGVFHKKDHVVGTKEAFGWSSLWISVSLAFSGMIFLIYSNGWVANPLDLSAKQAVIKYLTGYAIELSLSLDNIFVIALILAFFKIPKHLQHRVLFWGIIGSIVFRAIMILAGVMLINQFSWMMYLFGGLLLYSAYRMLKPADEELDIEKNPFVRFTKRFFPITENLEGNQFFVRKNGLLMATPLFLTLVVVETSDVLFAIDSIPAILGITTDPFLVFSSNIFAILGLRSLYFVLSAMLDKFEYLKYSLISILAFVGVKMIMADFLHIPEWLSLSVIVMAMLTGILISVFKSRKKSFAVCWKIEADSR